MSSLLNQSQTPGISIPNNGPGTQASSTINAISSTLVAFSNATSANTNLPSGRVPVGQLGTAIRNIAHWFVPEVGVVKMYLNPQSIAYNLKKLITNERTKGGYIVQYWGEELTTLNLRGHTGSSGVEGLNVLYEIYRAEQILFDPIALSMAANSSITGLNNAMDASSGNMGGLNGNVNNATGLFQVGPASQSILPRVTPSLASIALGMELYWSGWVFRGYFNSFSFTESAERIGLFEYDISFTVTERSGYRTNSLPWQHSAVYGPSDWASNALSFNDLASPLVLGPITSALATVTGE